MKIQHQIIAIAAIVLLGVSSAKALVITGFGTSEFTIDGSTTWTTNQTATSLTLSGTDFVNSFAGSFNTANITGLSVIQLTATVATNPNSNFTLELFDSNFNSRVYGGNFSSFGTGSPQTVTLSFVSDNGLVLSDVIGLAVNAGGGPPGAAINFTVDTLTASAVPEPGTYALLGLGLLVLVAHRRLRKA